MHNHALIHPHHLRILCHPHPHPHANRPAGAYDQCLSELEQLQLKAQGSRSTELKILNNKIVCSYQKNGGNDMAGYFAELQNIAQGIDARREQQEADGGEETEDGIVDDVDTSLVQLNYAVSREGRGGWERERAGGRAGGREGGT